MLLHIFIGIKKMYQVLSNPNIYNTIIKASSTESEKDTRFQDYKAFIETARRIQKLFLDAYFIKDSPNLIS